MHLYVMDSVVYNSTGSLSQVCAYAAMSASIETSLP